MTPNDPYSGLTAPLTSKRCILYVYSTNIGTEYFKHGIYSQFFSSSECNLFQNSNVFGSCIIKILYTGCAKIKKKYRCRKVKQGFQWTELYSYLDFENSENICWYKTGLFFEICVFLFESYFSVLAIHAHPLHKLCLVFNLPKSE